jgi:nucleotide-binding universal stress UspA family protein
MVSHPQPDRIICRAENLEHNMTNILTEAPTPQALPPGNSRNIKKILVAVDLSPHSEETVAYAMKLAETYGACLALVHVCSPELGTEATNQKGNGFDQSAFSPEEQLENLAKKIRKTYPRCSAHLCVGDPADKIALMADVLHADLILVGNRQPSFLGRLFSLDEVIRIEHEAPCPVLICPETTSRA